MRPANDGALPEFIASWFSGLQPLPLHAVTADPARVAVFSADMLECFTRRGPLASRRVEALIPRIVELLTRAHGRGVRHLVLVEDAHHAESPEFDAFGPHCLQGSDEARTVAELAALPFAQEFVVIRKNSLSPAIHTPLDPWLDVHPEVTSAIVVGNSTDLCVYQLAAHLRLRADALDLPGYRVIVPANLVDCYDLPADEALQAGLKPHPAAFFHPVFLYHLGLIGVEVVRELSW
jgi:nicotinamidase-related amidase